MLFNTLVLLALAATAALSDICDRRVSNRLNLAILAAGLGWRTAQGGWSPLVGLAGAALGLSLLLVPLRARWLGAGDVKLAAAFGAWLGPVGIVWATLAGLAGGGLLSIGIAWTGGRDLRRDVAGRLVSSLIARRAPAVPRRAAALTVPLAVPLGAAAVAAFALSVGVL